MRKVSWILCLALAVLVLVAGCKPVGDGIDKPEPTATPIPTATPLPSSPGTVSLSPATLTVSSGDSFTIDILVDTGGDLLLAYGLKLQYGSEISGLSAVSGADGFLTAANFGVEGLAVISGFDIGGKGPSSTLHLLTVTFNAVSAGTTNIDVVIDALSNAGYEPIGTPGVLGATVIVQ